MTPKATVLKKAAITHLLRAVAGVSGHSSFVIVGTGAVIAQLRTVPLGGSAWAMKLAAA